MCKIFTSSCLTGLTPRNQLGSFHIKNDDAVTEFDNAITKISNYRDFFDASTTNAELKK